MNSLDLVYPFTALVGQDLLRRALLLNAVCPALGGVLIAGERGTAKSTAARALAALLPRHPQGTPAPFVELPLGATEDRVAGSLDLERTLSEQRPVFRPGLLAAADLGVLYIDEVNLLADHLVDLLLDAAASGSHVVEREGIAVRHPARFLLVGTMNPEEGELRPQLADRFGLRVNVTAPSDPEQRAEVVRRRLAFDADPVRFAAAWADEQRRLCERLAAARALFPSVTLTDEQLSRVAAVCSRHNVEGLRADLALGRAARALAACDQRADVSADDLQRAAELVLPHRVRPAGKSPPAPQEPLPDLFGEDSPEEGAPPTGESHGEASPRNGETTQPPGPLPPSLRAEMDGNGQPATPDRGRRVAIPGENRGRYVRAVPDRGTGDIALDATLRAAALRGATEGRLTVEPADLHRKVREVRTGSLVVFVVDASGSMGARSRMEAVKAAALALLTDAGRLRDEVAIVAVRGPQASFLLPPTPDVGVAQRALTRLPTGGRTPLAHGLALAAELLHSTTPNRPILLLVVSDGKANVPLPGTDGDPWAQALAACAAFSPPRVKAVVIDADEGFVKSDRVRQLAAALAATCVPLSSFSADAVPTAEGGGR
jgi:magnesium chelatase subunit D